MFVALGALTLAFPGCGIRIFISIEMVKHMLTSAEPQFAIRKLCITTGCSLKLYPLGPIMTIPLACMLVDWD